MLPFTAPEGALILSTGKASAGTTASNAAAGTSTANNATKANDADMAGISTQMGYSTMALYDTAILEFDFTTTISGPVSFQSVLGSEEYPEYAPPTCKSAHACCMLLQLCSAVAV